MVNSQRKYQAQLAKKVKSYHEKPAGDKTSPQEWKTAYSEVARLLAAVLVAFHYQMDKSRGDDVQGPGYQKFYDAGFDRDMPEDDTLKAYIEHRNVSISDDEAKYLSSLVDKKVDLPIFLLASTEDFLKRISQTDNTSLSAPKALLEFVVADDLMREEIIELFLEDDSE